MDLDIKIDPYLLQIHFESAHQYQNPIQLDLDHVDLGSDPIHCHP